MDPPIYIAPSRKLILTLNLASYANGNKTKKPNVVMKVGCDNNGIREASRIIGTGGIAVFPTDTVYGIGCDPYNAESVKRVYGIKGRDTSKPLPILVYSIEVAEEIGIFDDFARNIAERFWPGPLTIILGLADKRLKESMNLREKIAIRVPGHRCTLNLLSKCNFLVGTSANISGQPPFTDPSVGLDAIQNDVFVDGGIISGGTESTIIETEGEMIRIVRHGVLTEEVLKG